MDLSSIYSPSTLEKLSALIGVVAIGSIIYTLIKALITFIRRNSDINCEGSLVSSKHIVLARYLTVFSIVVSFIIIWRARINTIESIYLPAAYDPQHPEEQAVQVTRYLSLVSEIALFSLSSSSIYLLLTTLLASKNTRKNP